MVHAYYLVGDGSSSIKTKDCTFNLLLMGGEGGMYQGGEVSAVLVGAFTSVVVVQCRLRRSNSCSTG